MFVDLDDGGGGGWPEAAPGDIHGSTRCDYRLCGVTASSTLGVFAVCDAHRPVALERLRTVVRRA
jgi:hypothetical protein